MLSRVADNLYWMSRYIERAQHTSRLLDAALGFMLDQSPQLIDRRWNRVLRSLHVHEPRAGSTAELEIAGVDTYVLAHRLAFDVNNEVSIFSCVRAARENARQVREEISGEMWECLNRLYLRVREARPAQGASTPAASPMTQSLGGMTQSLSTQGMSQTMGAMAQSTQAFWRQPHEFFADLERSAFEFEGATDATMRHGQGWLFIQVGRGLEQAAKTAALLNVYFSEDESDEMNEGTSEEGSLKWTALLKSCAAFEPYCRAHSPRLQPRTIAQFLLLDPLFPRSISASILRVENALEVIVAKTGDAQNASPANAHLARLAGRLKARLEYAALDDIMESGLPQFLKTIQEDCVRIHTAIYHAYIGYMAE